MQSKTAIEGYLHVISAYNNSEATARHDVDESLHVLSQGQAPPSNLMPEKKRNKSNNHNIIDQLLCFQLHNPR